MHGTARPTLVILHGACGSAAVMAPLVETLGDGFEVVSLDMAGHGGREVPPELSVAMLANDVISQLDARRIGRAFVFGYSAGGCVALHVARHFPERVLGVSTLAAKYVFDPQTIARWTHLADPARLRRAGNRAEVLAELHAPQNWVDVATSNRRMFEKWERSPPLSEADLRAIAHPALLFSSDQDQLVPLDETIALGKLLQNSRVVLFRGQSHPLSIVPLTAVGRALSNWIGEVHSGRFAKAVP